jgi:hypothetical protein
VLPAAKNNNFTYYHHPDVTFVYTILPGAVVTRSTAPSLAVNRTEMPRQGFIKHSSSINIHNNIIMKFGTPATQALFAFASVALLSSLRTAIAAPAPVCDSPTTPTNNEGAVLVRFWEGFVGESHEIGADCPYVCADGESCLLVFLLSSSL